MRESKQELFISDDRMLKLIEWAISTGIVDSRSEFLNKVGAGRNNISGLLNGERSFTTIQILEAATLTGVNINWLFGLEKNMLRDEKKHSALDVLKAAVMSVEKDMQPKKRR